MVTNAIYIRIKMRVNYIETRGQTEKQYNPQFLIHIDAQKAVQVRTEPSSLISYQHPTSCIHVQYLEAQDINLMDFIIVMKSIRLMLGFCLS